MKQRKATKATITVTKKKAFRIIVLCAQLFIKCAFRVAHITTACIGDALLIKLVSP